MENNLTLLSQLKVDEVKKCLRKRYEDRTFYTWAGPTLVAINPMNEFPENYTDNVMQRFATSIQSLDIPHIFAIGERALSHLKWNLEKSHQAVVVNGESGAGKTCSTRHLLSYLAFRERTSIIHSEKKLNFQDIELLVCESNPLLETLGNAVTLRNHNSSRFGKLVRLYYSGEGDYTCLEKASIETYLLESTRVAKQAAGERNFHVFYQMLAGLPDSVLEELELKTYSWKIAPSLPNERDKQLFNQTLRSMEILGLKESQLPLWKLLAALLHLGNVEFYEDEGLVGICENSRQHLNVAARFLGLAETDLSRVITVKTFTAGKNLVERSCGSAAECAARRDTLLKLLYRLAFDMVLAKVNVQLWKNETSAAIQYKHLCILDLYGFESFVHGNSLEQLCINYANERLQYYFTLNYLNEQLATLQQEGIEFCDVDLHVMDKQRVISTLDGPVSVFGVLNEECYLNRESNDTQICLRINEALHKPWTSQSVTNSPALKNIRRGAVSSVNFSVCHYAGPVIYQTTDMLEKNKDNVPAELVSVLSRSKSDFVCGLVAEEADSLSRNVKSGRKNTVLAKFKNSLDNLILTLKSCNAHYVRCVRPNSNLEGSHWDEDYVEMQLNACGVLDTVKVSSFGFPLRMKISEFASRYVVLLDGFYNLDEVSYRDICQEIIRKYPILASDIQLGQQLVYMTDSGLETAEKIKHLLLKSAAKKIQNWWRSHRRQKAARTLQKWWKKRIAAIRMKRKAKEVATAVRTVKKTLRRWALEKRKKKALLEKYAKNVKNDLKTSPEASVGSIKEPVSGAKTEGFLEENAKNNKNDLKTSLETSMDSIKEPISGAKRWKNRAVAVVPPTARSPIGTPVPSCGIEKSKFVFAYGAGCGIVTLQLPHRSLFYRDGVLTTRNIPQVRLRLSVNKKCLLYSNTLPKTLLPQGLMDAF